MRLSRLSRCFSFLLGVSAGRESCRASSRRDWLSSRSVMESTDMAPWRFNHALFVQAGPFENREQTHTRAELVVSHPPACSGRGLWRVGRRRLVGGLRCGTQRGVTAGQLLVGRPLGGKLRDRRSQGLGFAFLLPSTTCRLAYGFKILIRTKGPSRGAQVEEDGLTDL